MKAIIVKEHELASMPDWAYGERWPIQVSVEAEATDAAQGISDHGLPDRAIIWEILWQINSGVTGLNQFRLALSDVLPVTQAEFHSKESVFPQTVIIPASSGYYNIYGSQPSVLNRLKKVIRPQGRKFCLRFVNNDTAARTLQVIVVISSIPRELPEWVSWVPA